MAMAVRMAEGEYGMVFIGIVIVGVRRSEWSLLFVGDRSNNVQVVGVWNTTTEQCN
jgi:hypothetical protein